MNVQTLTKWALVAAIVIILNLFFVFSVRLVFSEPQYDDFCAAKQSEEIPQEKNACVDAGGQWITAEGTRTPAGTGPYYTPRPELPVKGDMKAYCNPYFTCEQEYRDAREEHERNFFVALVVLGTAALIAGFAFQASELFSSAFSLGAVLTYIIASVRYWSEMDDYLRVIVLGVALVALLWFGIKKFEQKKK